MRVYALFIIAFLVIAASLYKSQVGTSKRISAKKQRPVLTEPQWPGLMKKTNAEKAIVRNKNRFSEESNAAVAETASAVPAVKPGRKPARGVASVSPDPSATELARQKVLYTGGTTRYRPRGYTSGSFYYGVYTPESIAAQAQAGQTSRQASNSNVNDFSGQELSSFTRTPDLSINISIDPELADTFEDHIRKFREQNQLTSQELQQLELIINAFGSISNSVQRGQVPLQQVNAEAIKLTRSFFNLKKRVELRGQ